MDTDSTDSANAREDASMTRSPRSSSPSTARTGWMVIWRSTTLRGTPLVAGGVRARWRPGPAAYGLVAVLTASDTTRSARAGDYANDVSSCRQTRPSSAAGCLPATRRSRVMGAVR
jgi:hypothetical protein